MTVCHHVSTRFPCCPHHYWISLTEATEDDPDGPIHQGSIPKIRQVVGEGLYLTYQCLVVYPYISESKHCNCRTP